MKPFWRNTSAKTHLILSALGSGLIYLAFTLPFLLSRYYAVTPPVDYAKLTQHSAFGFIAFLVGIFGLFSLYIITLRTLARGKISEKLTVRIILMGSLLFAFILLFSYPLHAIDMLVYALYARGWALYGMLPFSTPPNALPAGDPWLGLAGEWAGATSPYGPIWEGLSLSAYYLSGGNYLAHLFVLKLVGMLAFLGSAWLVYQILRLVKPEWAIVGLAFFAWNPLVLIESVQNAHNDIVMVFFLLIAIWAYVRLMQGLDGRKYYLYSGLFILGFSLSILVKFVTILILPFLVLGLALQQRSWMRRFAVVALDIGLIMLLVVLAMLPFWPGLDNWAVLQVGKGAGRSLFALLVLAIKPQVDSTATAFDYTSILIYSIFGSIYFWGLWQVISGEIRKDQGKASKTRNNFETPIRVSFYIFFWYVLLTANVFHAWYLLWFMPLAAILVPRQKSTSAALTFSLLALLIIPYYETIRVWIPILNRNHLLGHTIGVSLLLIPVLLALWKPLPLLPTGDQGRGNA